MFTNKSILLRALIEGKIMSLYNNLISIGINFKNVVLTGGGSNSCFDEPTRDEENKYGKHISPGADFNKKSGAGGGGLPKDERTSCGVEGVMRGGRGKAEEGGEEQTKRGRPQYTVLQHHVRRQFRGTCWAEVSNCRPGRHRPTGHPAWIRC